MRLKNGTRKIVLKSESQNVCTALLSLTQSIRGFKLAVHKPNFLMVSETNIYQLHSFYKNNFKRKGQQSCSIRKSIQSEWGAVIAY